MNEAKLNILIVDDNPDSLEMLKRKISGRGFAAITADDVPHALEIVQNQVVDIVLTDYKMPKLTGLDLIRHIKDHFPHIKVIMITGYPTIEGAVEAVKVGAEEYLTKPFTDEELFRSIDKAVDKVRHQKIAAKPAITINNPFGIVGISPAMQRVYRLIEKSCTNNATVLIEGESGTGKELVARAIHYHSKREVAPFVPVNCAAIPETLLESELFGYMKGSFTGASETRAGYFITADGGTIFLDEIGETSLSMQVKLLRVLQDKQVFMIGAKSPRKVNLRIITATNKDLKLLINQGSFREDLYYRLNVLSIPIPPLRERQEDIVPLVYYFLDKYSRENAQTPPKIGDDVLETLQDYHWPGNVRELENLIYRLLVMNEGEVINPSMLPDYMKFTIPSQKKLDRTLAEVEMEHIEAVLRSVDGNKTLAASILGIDRKTLHNKLTRN